MSKLNDQELSIIVGGFSLSGTFLSAISRAMKILYEIGQSLGTSLNMIKNNKTCK